MFSKRVFLQLGAGMGLGLLPLAARARQATAAASGIRGTIDARPAGPVPDPHDAGRAAGGGKLAQLVAKAARDKVPLVLPPGRYEVSNLILPDGMQITGTSGATRLVYGGGGFMLRAESGGRIRLSGLVIDGSGRGLDAETPGLVHLTGIADLRIADCEILASAKSGIHLERCGGRIEANRISGCGDCGLYAVDSSGLSITSNTVSDCGNGGILVHRWSKGFDGTMVTGNRIERIGAAGGGTGQYGNGINLFRTDGVSVTGNQITGAAFSAIRANSASNAQIANNQCFQSGETAIYAEFAFEGAVVSGNLVDGAANGISVVNFNEGGRLATVAGNIVRNLSTTGPYVLDEAIFGVGISVEADTAVTGNVVENAPLWGLALGFGAYLRDVVASGNVVRQAAIGCAVSIADGAGSAVIAGNVFQGMTGGAVIGHRWKDPATAELGQGGDAARAYPLLTIEGNRLV